MSQLTPQDILTIIELVESTASIQSFHLRHGELEVYLAKQGATAIPPMRSAPPPPDGRAGLPVQAPEPAPAPQPHQPPPPADRAMGGDVSAMALPPSATVVKSPTVGTYYAAKEPGAEPFVNIGQRVSAGSTLCIIEVMKVMNTVQSPIDGVVTRILVADATAVEFGQSLMVVEPA